MTLLVGQNGSTFTTPVLNQLPAPNAGDSFYCQNVYTAAATGTMSLAHISLFDASSLAGNVKICVYTLAGALVAVSSVIPVSGVSGDRTGSISGSITAGQQYFLVAIPDSFRVNCVGQSGASAFAVSGNTAAHFSYASPPGTLPAHDYTSSGQEPIMWIDGTVAGGSSENGTLMMTGMGT